MLASAGYKAKDIVLAHDMAMVDKLGDKLGPFKARKWKAKKAKAAIEEGAAEEAKDGGKEKKAKETEAPAMNFPGLDLQSYFGSKVALYFTWLVSVPVDRPAAPRLVARALGSHVSARPPNVCASPSTTRPSFRSRSLACSSTSAAIKSWRSCPNTTPACGR